MRLLVFAHRGEAQNFLKNTEFVANSLNLSLYKNDNHFILVSGEGIKNSLESVALCCGLIGTKIKEVLNLGIAGSLHDTIKTDSIYSIRTSYSHGSMEPRFNSYSSADQHAKVDCISASNRVVSSEDASRLKPFAKIVDRELWAIASISKRLNFPFRSYKLISDQAGVDTNCFDLKSKAKVFSETLYDFYEKETPSLPKPEDNSNILLHHPKMHFSKSMTDDLNRYLKMLAIKNNVSLNMLIDNFKVQDQWLKNDNKNNAKALLHDLQQQLTPKL